MKNALLMKLSLPTIKSSAQQLEAAILNEKIYTVFLLSLNIIYIFPKFTKGTDPSSVLIASIPPAFIISVVLTIIRDRYVKNTLIRRLMNDSYIPSVYKSDIDLRALETSAALKKEKVQTKRWIGSNILNRISDKS